MEEARTWTAEVFVADEYVSGIKSEFDLKRDQIQRSIADVIELLTKEEVQSLFAGERVGTFILFKTTKARGTEPDGLYHVALNRRRDGFVADGPYFVAPEFAR